MEAIGITKSRFKHDGLYALSSYYNVLYDVFRGLGYDVEETRYISKLNPDGSTKELEISWECRKKIDNYARIFIFCKTLIVGMGKQQTQIDGKPVSRNSGVLELELNVKIELDYDNKWVSSPFLSGLRYFYDKWFYSDTFNNIKERAATEMYTVENEMKAFFNMQTFT